MKRSLSVVIPAYNESRKIKETLEDVVATLTRRQALFEVIVVNDGSLDETADKVEDLRARFPQIRLLNNTKNSGKGEAIRQGIREARCELCLFMDADNSTKISEWDKFEPLFEKGSLAVIASRRLPASRIERSQPFARRFFGRGYRALCRVLFGLALSDFNCGFKAFDTSLAKKIYSQTVMSDWTFDVDALCRIKREGIPIAEVPVTWVHEDKSTHAAVLKTVFKSLVSLLKLKLQLAK